jgi:hypothetical protein
MAAEHHCSVDRNQSFWSAAEYYFPSVENDPLLYELGEDDEEIPVCSTIHNIEPTRVQSLVLPDVRFAVQETPELVRMLEEARIADETASVSVQAPAVPRDEFDASASEEEGEQPEDGEGREGS